MTQDDLQARLLELMAQPGYGPLRKRALAKKLRVSMDDYPEFRGLIEALTARGQITELRRGKYGLPLPSASGSPPASSLKRRNATLQVAPLEEEVVSLEGLPRGVLVGRIAVKRGGFGFLLSDPPGNDLYIAVEDLHGALNGDWVAVQPRRHQHGRKRKGGAGRVLKILKRARTTLVGTFYRRPPKRFDPPQGPAGYLVPDARGVFEELEIPAPDCGAAQEGDKVCVELVESDGSQGPGQTPTARVIRVFGQAGEAKAELAAIVENFGLRTEFPEPVLEQVEGISLVVPEAELERRVDLTAPLTFTIDPEDAKDHDDAVALRTLPDGRTELLVHIADVSHYVTAGSPLDLEARERATSVYLPGQVLPMLPQKLSNNLCSLREGELRLTKTVRIAFSKKLLPQEVRLEKSFIRSAAFLTYDQVRKSVDEDDHNLVPTPAIFEALKEMKDFSARLRARRLAAGSIDLDLPEVKLILDSHGRVISFEKEEHHWAHQLIEEMMLAANQAVAEYLVHNEVLGLFRVHEEPDPGDLEQFAEFSRELGVRMRRPYDRASILAVLERVKGEEIQHSIHLALLTSLKQARYAAECQPHFALNFLRYLHFTSPIRRYPDLLVHRMLDLRFGPGQPVLSMQGRRRQGGGPASGHYQQVASLRGLAQHCSERERNADAAEEEVKRFRQIQFLKHNLRASHPGIIKGVREQGLIVELEDCHVEGFVRVQDLADDYYEYFAEHHLLQGRRKQRSFRLGDKVEARVLQIDVGKKQVGLAIV